MDNLIKNVIEKYNVKDLEELHDMLCVLYPSYIVNYFNHNQEKFKAIIGV